MTLLTFSAFFSNVADTFDLPIFLWFQNNLWNPALDIVMAFMSWLGEKGSIFIPMGLILLCFKKTRKLGVTMLAAMAFEEIINGGVIKTIFARVRPYNYDGYTGTDFVYPALGFFGKVPASWSFPSGHTASAFAAATVFSMNTRFVKDRDRTRMIVGSVIFYLFAALMGASRIYLHDHYPSDVLGGAVCGILYGVLGFFIGLAIYKAIEKITEKLKQKKTE